MGRIEYGGRKKLRECYGGIKAENGHVQQAHGFYTRKMFT